MSFRLTYGTMFNPPEAMHERFEAALADRAGPARRRCTRFTSTGGIAMRRARAATQPDRPRT